MDSIAFINSVYVGDRLCRGIQVLAHVKELKLYVDLISRIRDTGWNFYSAEDVEDGCLVFEGLVSFDLTPAGFLPNDWIEIVGVDRVDAADAYKVTFSLVQ